MDNLVKMDTKKFALFVIATFALALMLVLMRTPVFATTAPAGNAVSSTNVLTTAYSSIASAIFDMILSIIGGTAAVVILFHLWKIITGTSRETEASIVAIKRCIICIVLAYMVVPGVSLIITTAKTAGGTTNVQSLFN